MKKLILAFCLFLSACGSGSNPGTPVAVAPAVNPNVIVAVQVNQDLSQGDYFLKNITFRTADNKQYDVEYCNDDIKVGDVLTLKEYGVGTTLMIVNGSVISMIVDEKATEDWITNFTPERAKAYDDAYDWDGLRALLYKDQQ